MKKDKCECYYKAESEWYEDYKKSIDRAEKNGLPQCKVKALNWECSCSKKNQQK